ncbi:Uncharacterised protein [Mycobacteroides abscessus]|uniref:CDGP domain-containing protein n=1 Tax=Mycobacteroides abscessus TaxID=36809 RepID=UPI000364B093|nr:hypothetical protein [Mycobacteroides abscessus]MBE5514350.1 hypothetical protein [Mycobacteroides abscessus]MDM3920567.1 hypothetical protein [Mycobacteroides abscessus]CPT77276.1 Uncharacterised protein [Mycobacteroides abscessus]CPU48427.1 Uncharacterised protein [Mycobacteroides abscessus]SIK17106.1 Uncharacterised protein [Mycobacteroides abscessus subsp. abscessus]
MVGARALFTAAGVTASAVALAPAASADDPAPPGCQTDRVGVFGTQFRTICDDPKAPDGSWQRTRKVVMPGQRFLVTTNVYTVTADTIPPGEPGHIE